MGSFLMSVQYRRECGFMYNPATYEQQHEDISGIAAIDDTYFTPTLSSRNNSNFSLPRLAHQQPSPQQQHQPQHHSVTRRATLTTIPSHGRQTSANYSPPVRPQHTPSASHSAASQLAAGHRSLIAPSVNPFRARPLSLGDSSSLPSYLGDSFAPRVPSRLSAESHRQNDTYPRRAAGRDIVRDQQRRISVGGRSYLSGQGDEAGDPASLDQKISSLGQLSTSGGHGGPDSGSMLHRGVMIRRLGGSLSPTESHRPMHHHHGSSPGTGSAEAAASGSKSPPWYASMASRPSVPGSAGSSTSRSGLAFVSPFKSPSVSSSPSRIMDTAIASGLHDAHHLPQKHGVYRSWPLARHGRYLRVAHINWQQCQRTQPWPGEFIWQASW
ncbi:hypothetical protein DL89DRAFT_51220 [Linderina pennispora]|uniref:Uncharacterized protein n=1 Tax=Linderina pennispora TaxID=61395 RepID=A0A1Y1W0I8_9FUNG|nr:uncharacterized protein DL89DRAFT_51220 [Linderina pennispora]ORX67040.1 hypothetical protein DL89DRAFT_51220 [Linderina pennispora]